MAERSPNYPAISLDKAVQDVKAFFAREGRSSVPADAAVKAWGFKGITSGPARVRIGALRQYGLIETDRQGSLKLSARGLTLAMMPANSIEYATALREAALSPTIFMEIFADRRDASDESLRYYLVNTRKFLPEGAARLIEAYRSTVRFAGLNGNQDSEGFDTQNEDDANEEEIRDESPGGEHPRRKGEFNRYSLPGGIVAEVSFSGNPVTPRAIKMLRAYLELHEESLALDEGMASEQGHLQESETSIV